MYNSRFYRADFTTAQFFQPTLESPEFPELGGGTAKILLLNVARLLLAASLPFLF